MRTRSQARREEARKAFEASIHHGCSEDANAESASSKHPEDKFDCPICYECPTHEATASVCGCNHKFCFSCIDQWAETKNTCPLCNGEFTKVIRGSNTVPESKTYSGNKRKREMTLETEARMAAIRARIAENDVRQAEIQRQIDVFGQMEATLDSEARMAAIRARITENDARQAEIQRQIDMFEQQQNALRIEPDQVGLGIEMHRLRMENMRMQTEEFMLQRIEIERLITRIRTEIAVIGNMAVRNGFWWS